MSTITVLYIDNDNILEVCHVREELTGDFLNSATVQVTLFNSDGAETTGDTWPKPMPYVANSKGVYRVLLPASLDLQPNGRYAAEIVVDAGSGLLGKWTVDCVARVRGS
jgi:hypothetical protein